MPKQSSKRSATGTFSTTPGAKEFVLANYKSMSLTQLSDATGVTYGSIAEFLRRNGMRANRSSLMRSNIAAFLTMPPNELAYLAGIVDGEGTITIARRKNHLRPMLQVSNTSWLLREWLMQRGFSSTIQKNNLGRLYFRMEITGWSIGQILEKLLPYLVIKHLHALILLKITEIRKSMPFRWQVPEDVLLLIAEIKELNMRGFRFEKDQEHALRYSTLSQKLESSLQMAR